jgi:superfamily II DNA or RNA helicase
VATVLRRLPFLDSERWAPDLIIVDEGHHAVQGSTWGGVLDHWPRARAVLFTATPLRLDGLGLGVDAGGYADALIEGPSVADLTAAGYLVPAELHVPGAPVDLSGVAIHRGDFAAAQLEALADKPVLIGDAVAHYRAHCLGLPAIAFCCSIAHAEHVAAAFQSAGVPSVSIDGKLSGLERDRRLAGLADGSVRVLTSCELIDEGLDVPAATVAMLLRPTASTAKHRQQVGRVLRPAPGKTRAVICDHVQNCQRHGAPDKAIHWSLEGVTRDGAPADAPRLAATTREGLERFPEERPGLLVRAESDGFGGLRLSDRQLAFSLPALRRVEVARGYPRGWADRMAQAMAA